MERNNYLNYLRFIQKKAEEWKKEGYKVKANIDGYGRPKKIDELIPDLRAERKEKIIIGKVETKKGLEANRETWESFKNYAESKENVSFRLYLMSEDGSCHLYKQFK